MNERYEDEVGEVSGSGTNGDKRMIVQRVRFFKEPPPPPPGTDKPSADECHDAWGKKK